MSAAIGHIRAAEAAIRDLHPRDVVLAYADLLAELGSLTAALHESAWAVDGAGEALADLRRAIVRARERTGRGGIARLGEGGKGGG